MKYDQIYFPPMIQSVFPIFFHIYILFLLLFCSCFSIIHDFYDNIKILDFPSYISLNLLQTTYYDNIIYSFPLFPYPPRSISTQLHAFYPLSLPRPPFLFLSLSRKKTKTPNKKNM